MNLLHPATAFDNWKWPAVCDCFTQLAITCGDCCWMHFAPGQTTSANVVKHFDKFLSVMVLLGVFPLNSCPIYTCKRLYGNGCLQEGTNSNLSLLYEQVIFLPPSFCTRQIRHLHTFFFYYSHFSPPFFYFFYVLMKSLLYS